VLRESVKALLERRFGDADERSLDPVELAALVE